MVVSSLRLRGFKSFGRFCEFMFSKNFTVIVGPNGSGKSNILDALKWILGEGSASGLRITRQSDLLFHGSSSSGPAKVAEAIIKLSSDKHNATLKRVYSQESGAVLFLDNRKILLQDMTSVKAEFNLEGEGFALIGQGEIAQTIPQRPRERRRQFDTLFGIERYRERRDDSLQKLDDALHEADRIKTLRLDELNECADIWSKGINFYESRLIPNMRHENYSVHLDEINTRKNIIQRKAFQAASQIRDILAKRVALTSELDGLQAIQQENYDVVVLPLKNELRLLQERINVVYKLFMRVDSEHNSIVTRIQSYEYEILSGENMEVECCKILFELAEEKKSAHIHEMSIRQEISRYNDEFRNARRRLEELRERVNVSNANIMVVKNVIADINGKLTHLDSERAQLIELWDYNLVALSEYKSLMERIDFLSEQLDDDRFNELFTRLFGGEQSLTAIALIFATLDTALDEYNLIRFADLAREHALRLQIIAMTHRRATMERAELIYGVTMIEPGLSATVSINPENYE